MSKKTKTSTKKPASETKAVKQPAEPAPTNDGGKAKKTPKPRKTSGLDAAHDVLKASGGPMRCKDMVDAMLAKGLWKTGGKTPAATIYSAILREINTKGRESRFKKTDRGLFTLA